MSLFKDKIELEIQEVEVEAEKRLSEFPPLARWLFIGCLIAIIPAYFIARTISNRYWLSQYGKYLIAAKPSFENPLPPEVSSVSITSLGPSTYAAVATIKNPNVDLSLEAVPYSFQFFNAQSQLIYTSPPNTLFLLPNQTKYLMVPKLTLDETIAAAKLQLPEELPWQKRLNIPVVNLVASQPRFYNQSNPTTFVVEGDVFNNSPYNLQKIHLTLILKNFSQNTIGISQRDEFTLKPFERRAYKQLWPQTDGINVVSVEVIAETDTLDNQNLNLPEQPTTPASNLNRPSNNNY